jgi:peptidoglycan/xylan/chitin deacetylase (PgdA/CDA1 family)
MEALLDLLSENNAHATFFITSDYIAKTNGMTEIMNRIVVEGHEICNHMPEDKYYSMHGDITFKKELEKSEMILNSYKKKGGKDNAEFFSKNKLFRPPSGLLSKTMTAALKELEYTGIILGDVFNCDLSCTEWLQ